MNEVVSIFLENHIVIVSLVPAIVSIFLAFKYKNVFISLGIGLYVGLILDAILNNGSGILKAIIGAMLSFPIMLTESLGDYFQSGIVIQVLLISGFVYVLNYTGGLKAIARAVSKYANTKERTELLTFGMGFLVFFDDYANSLIVGPVMRTVTDRAKISREKLAFIIDSTAAPIAGIVIVSTWIGYELGLIQEQLSAIPEFADVSAMLVFVNSIPFRIYNILMLIFIVILIKTKREYGPMYDAEVRARKGKSGALVDHDENQEIDGMKVKENYEAKLYEGIVPLLTLIISSFIFFYVSGANADGVILRDVSSISDMFYNFGIAFSNADVAVVLSQSSLLAIMVTFILSRKAFTPSEGIDFVITGASKLMPTVFVLLLAWSIGGVMSADHLNTGNNIALLLGDAIPYQILPLIIFLLSAIMAFSTGTSYGTMGILFPLVVPLAYITNPELSFLVISIGAILTGTILGDHCSPISDTTILSSAGADVEHMAHVKTQMPYAITVGAISAFGYLIVGMMANTSLLINHTWLVMIGLFVLLSIIIYVVIRILGKKVI